MNKLRTLLFLVLFLGAGCASSDESGESENNSNTPLRMLPDNNTVSPNNTNNVNNGNNQNNLNNSNNSNNQNNTNNVVTNNGTNNCPDESCFPGLTECVGAQERACVEDAANPGCGVWQEPADCPSPQQTCVATRCEIPQGCVDNDNDQHGLNCPAGPDCDDSNNLKFPGNPEVCDGIDNDCNGMDDDGLGVGTACQTGTGACAATGVSACDPQGMVFCDVVPGTVGEPEICDGVDNDCNMAIDDGGACDVCTADLNEPNDTIATATTLNVDSRLLGVVCPGDSDFFKLSVTAGNTVRIGLKYPEIISNLNIVGYEDGLSIGTFDSFDVDEETIVLTASANIEYVIEIQNTGTTFNLYHVSLLDTDTQICAGEDTFAPNTTRATSAFLPPGWLTEAGVCGGSEDWYFLGEVTMGETIRADIYNTDIGGDLDLFLHGDPDGDGTYQQLANSSGSGTDEFFNYLVTQTGDYYLRVFDYSGIGDEYDIEWQTTP